MVFVQITLKVSVTNRAAAAEVYQQFKTLFLDTVVGAKSKDLLLREEDVQVLLGFDTEANATAYLHGDMFTVDVATALSPLLDAAPEARVYEVA